MRIGFLPRLLRGLTARRFLKKLLKYLHHLAHLAKPFRVRDFYAVLDACLAKPAGQRGIPPDEAASLDPAAENHP